MAAWDGKGGFRDLLAADPEVAKKLSRKELGALFDIKHHLKHVDTIFRRVFGKGR
jgi:adenylosuccinate lyase